MNECRRQDEKHILQQRCFFLPALLVTYIPIYHIVDPTQLPTHFYFWSGSLTKGMSELGGESMVRMSNNFSLVQVAVFLVFRREFHHVSMTSPKSRTKVGQMIGQLAQWICHLLSVVLFVSREKHARWSSVVMAVIAFGWSRSCGNESNTSWMSVGDEMSNTFSTKVSRLTHPFIHVSTHLVQIWFPWFDWGVVEF